MKPATHLPTRDVRHLLAVLGEVSECRHDPVAWRRHLLTRLCDLADATHGTAAVTGTDSPDAPPHTSLLVEHGFAPTPARDQFLRCIFDTQSDDPFRQAFLRQVRAHAGRVITRRRQDLVPDRLWYAHPTVNTVRQAAGVDHLVASACTAAVPGLAMLLILYRPWRKGKPFAPREHALLDLCNHALIPLYRAEQDGSRHAPALSPRLRQTLAHLLAGRSEKEIADAMTLSRHTIHDYIKALYRHYKVTSRSELLAKFIT